MTELEKLAAGRDTGCQHTRSRARIDAALSLSPSSGCRVAEFRNTFRRRGMLFRVAGMVVCQILCLETSSYSLGLAFLATKRSFSGFTSACQPARCAGMGGGQGDGRKLATATCSCFFSRKETGRFEGIQEEGKTDTKVRGKGPRHVQTCSRRYDGIPAA